MLQTSRHTLAELHHVCGHMLGRLWADPSMGLTRFGVLRSLTLHEIPALGAFWLSRLPASLESLTFAVAPPDEQASVPDNG